MADSVLARRRAKKNGSFNYAHLARLQTTRIVPTEEKIETPKFLKKGKGVMCVSPVSPNNPLTPGRFFSEYVMKNKNLGSLSPRGKAMFAKSQFRSSPKKQADFKMRAVKDALIAVQRMASTEARKKSVVQNRRDDSRIIYALKESAKNVKTALQGALETAELIEWMSKGQKQKLFRGLEELSQLTHDVLGGHPNSTLHLGSEDLHIKSLLVQLTGRYTKLDRQLESDAHSFLQAPVQPDGERTVRDQLEAFGIDKVTRSYTLALEAAKLFKEAALFAPVGALKTLEEGKKAVGEGMLKALGLKGLAIDERTLNVKLRLLFDEIDSNKSGELDEDEVKQSLIKMGMTLNEQSLKEFLVKADSNGDGGINFREWREYVTSILTSNKVHILHDRAPSPHATPLQPPVPASAPAASTSQPSAEALLWQPTNLFGHATPQVPPSATPPPAPPRRGLKIKTLAPTADGRAEASAAAGSTGSSTGGMGLVLSGKAREVLEQSVRKSPLRASADPCLPAPIAAQAQRLALGELNQAAAAAGGASCAGGEAAAASLRFLGDDGERAAGESGEGKDAAGQPSPGKRQRLLRLSTTAIRRSDLLQHPHAHSQLSAEAAATGARGEGRRGGGAEGKSAKTMEGKGSGQKKRRSAAARKVPMLRGV